MRMRFSEQNNCSWVLPPSLTNSGPDEGYTSNLNPVGRGPPSMKEDYPSHIPVVKSKTEDTQPGNMLPRAPVSNW